MLEIKTKRLRLYPLSDSEIEKLIANEAVEALINWAFNNNAVLFVEAEADENNSASIHILEKIGFKKYGYGEEGPRFVKAKPV